MLRSSHVAIMVVIGVSCAVSAQEKDSTAAAKAAQDGTPADSSLDSLLNSGPAAPPANPAPAQPAAGAATSQPEAAAQTPQSSDLKSVQQGDSSGHGSDAALAAPDKASTEVNAAAPKSRERAPSRNRMIEEIVVTAEKREESLEDVPVAVSAFSAGKLDAAGIQSTADLPMLTPGLTVTGNAGFDLIYLRGIGTSAFIPSFDPSVATYVDGIYIPNQQGTLTDLGGVERVEVLKGPQGTLFGRNSDGGAINIITKTPGSAPELSASQEDGNYRLSRTKLYGSFPLTSSLAVNFSGLYSRQDSYYKLVSDPQSTTAPPDYALLPDKSMAGRVRVSWHPTEDFDFTVTGLRVLQSGSAPFIEPNVAPNPILGSIPGLSIHPAGAYATNQNTPPLSHSMTSTLYGNAKWSLPWLDIKALGGAEKQNSYNLQDDFDGGQPNIVTFTAPSEPSFLRTAELQFVSNDKGFTPSWIKWIGGLYYLQQRAGYQPFVAYVGDTGLLPPIPGVTIGPADSVVGLGAYGMLATHSVSAYLQSTVDFTDWVGLTLGGRVQKEGRVLDRSSFFVVLEGNQQNVSTYIVPKVDQENFSPKVSLQFRLIENTLIYLSWSRAYKGGSYNVVTLYTPPQYVQPEANTSYEIGIKTTYFEGLQFNAAIFDNQIRNLQETKLSLLSGGAITVENAPAAHSRGVEFGVSWAPFLNLDPGFAVNGGATLLDAVYTNYPDASGFDPTTGLSFGGSGLVVGGGVLPGRDFSGHHIARTPTATGSLNISQTIDTKYGPIELSGDIYYNSGFNFTSQNASNTAQDAYWLFNARASYLYEPWHIRLSSYGRNLAARKYFDTSLVTDFGVAEHYAAPRMYGLILSYNY